MAQESRNTLKGYFTTDSKPTEAQFADLIDSSVNFNDDDSNWQAPALQNGITDHQPGQSQSVRFRKINGIVYIEGAVEGGVAFGTGNVLIFTLPLGFTPPANLVFNVANDSNTPNRVEITSDGDVIVNIYDDIMTSLSGISFFDN